MRNWLHRGGAVAVAMLSWLGASNTVQAQFGVINNPFNNPYAAYQQQLANAQVQALGNLAAQQAFNNPYGPGAVANPYTQIPYNPYYTNPYVGNLGPGYTLMGSADVVRAYNQTLTTLEQARLLREQYYQSKLETKRKAFDLEMYIKMNTPSWSEEQAKITRSTLKRIQSASNPHEIANGFALNFVLDDLRKYPNKKISAEPIQMEESMLQQLNVAKGTGSIGLGALRNDGKLAWPSALADLIPAEQRKTLESQTVSLVSAAKSDRPDPVVLKDVRTQIDKIRTDLVSRANDYGTQQYLDAKRYLNDLEDGCLALERGEANVQAEFNSFVKGGKTAQEVVGYMVNKGLRFAPATQGDEGSYRAFHTALVAYDVALNAVLGTDSKE
jgi:hypothetical protein